MVERTFDEAFPDALELSIGEGEFIRTSDQLPCAICKRPTCFLEVNFAMPLCSRTCGGDAWEAYNEALRVAPG